MQDHLVIQLLHKNLTGEISASDKDLLLDWLNQSNENKHFGDSIRQVWDLSANYTPSFTPNVEQGIARFTERIQANPSHLSVSHNQSNKVIELPSKFIWRRIAAACLIVLGSVAVWKMSSSLTVQQMQVATLAGQTEQIELADGSIIHLNEKSNLIYPSKFKGKTRQVRVSGEAFFDIAKNEKKPFVVDSDLAQVKVIGTSFNVNEINDHQIEVDVKSGTVEFQPNGYKQKITLSANEKGVFDLKTKELTPSKSKSSNAGMWVTKTLTFEDTYMSKVFSDLESFYGVTFEVDNADIKKCVWTSPVIVDKSLDEVLTMIKYSFNFNFDTKSNDKIIVSGESCN